MSILRFFLYQAFSSLAKLFIDREIKRHQAAIFRIVDKELWKGGPSHPLRGSVLSSMIAAATGLEKVDERQVQQVRDLFDPLAFAKGLGR
jgi:putative AlgH/UPF0301 family transcriptional regulator